MGNAAAASAWLAAVRALNGWTGTGIGARQRPPKCRCAPLVRFLENTKCSL